MLVFAVVPKPPKLVFRKSARMFAIRLGALLLLTFGGLAAIMYPDFKAAAIISGLGALVAVTWYLLTQHNKVVVEVDDEAIRRVENKDSQRIRWVDVKEVTLGETIVPNRSGGIRVRFAVVRGLGNQKIAFSDLTFIDGQSLTVGAPDPTTITNVTEADVLLALVTDRVEDERLLPVIVEENAEGEDSSTLEEEPDESGPAPIRQRRLRAGLLALFLKIGAKAVKPILGVFKGTQGVVALASLGIWALLFTWQVAVALMVMLLIHELGHVHAMRRSGLPVKGVYFIPLLGAATVPEDIWRSRSQQAYIALSGPLWSTLLNLIPVAIVLVFGNNWQIVPFVAGLWALLNFLNLLPIAPLDGGRVLSAVGNSINSRVGLALSLASLVVFVGAAVYVGFYLFALLGLIGLAEIAVERSSSSRARRLAFAGSGDLFGPDDLARFRQLTRPAFPDDSEERLREVELSRLERSMKMAAIEPMKPAKAALWIGLYFALLVTVGAILFWLVAINPELRAMLGMLR